MIEQVIRDLPNDIIPLLSEWVNIVCMSVRLYFTGFALTRDWNALFPCHRKLEPLISFIFERCFFFLFLNKCSAVFYSFSNCCARKYIYIKRDTLSSFLR